MILYDTKFVIKWLAKNVSALRLYTTTKRVFLWCVVRTNERNHSRNSIYCLPICSNEASTVPHAGERSRRFKNFMEYSLQDINRIFANVIDCCFLFVFLKYIEGACHRILRVE